MIVIITMVVVAAMLYYLMSRDDDNDPNIKLANVVYIITVLVVIGYLFLI